MWLTMPLFHWDPSSVPGVYVGRTGKQRVKHLVGSQWPLGSGRDLTGEQIALVWLQSALYSRALHERARCGRVCKSEQRVAKALDTIASLYYLK
jgi:hypothetical protein